MSLFKTNAIQITLLLLAACGGLNAQDYPLAQDNYEQNCCSSWPAIDNFSFKAEGLYWNVMEDGLGYARERAISTVTTVNPGLTTIQEIQNEKKVELHSNWTKGYRLGMGYNPPCSCWDLNLVYTHLNNKKCSSKSAPNDAERTVVGNVTTVTLTSLISVFPLSSLGVSSTNRIDATWNLDFNNLEFFIGRDFIFFNDCIGFRPFVGVKYLDIQQKYRVAMQSFDDLSLPTNTFGAGRWKIKSQYWGVGLQGGLDLSWKMGCGFAVYSQAAGGIVYGKRHARDRLSGVSFIRTAILLTTAREFSNKGSDWEARANVDFAVGIEWAYALQNCSVLTFNLGWEYHQYFDQNFFRTPYLVQTQQGGSLFLQGLVVGANYTF